MTRFVKLLGRLSCAVTGAVLAFAGLAGATFAAVPPDLSGQAFNANDFIHPIFTDPGEVEIVSSECEGGTYPAGKATFVATGPATGPYSGQFREEGTVEFRWVPPSSPPTSDPSFPTPSALPDGRVQATFEISNLSSGDPLLRSVYRVEGTKSYAGPLSASCFESEVSTPSGSGTELNYGSHLVRYEARIWTTEGTYTDSGTAQFGLAAQKDRVFPTPPVGGDPGDNEHFLEYFLSDDKPPVLTDPLTKEDCKDHASRPPAFRNQGDCISFVATGGRKWA